MVLAYAPLQRQLVCRHHPHQGYGTFESPDGARYVGGWRANLKHGIGRKVYANGDSYEGLWRDGKAEGPGRCVLHLRAHKGLRGMITAELPRGGACGCRGCC
mgnify:CR=1 FL=1